ncbi:MAG TPA: tetratricopeptide repeat protein [Vicinamibacterales bacterium]|jgi:tetratricopeptide (TPR) repeat protein|nr:tetratricopeptide repeat protein [Vicinamibacterales bacterium]
MPENPRLEELRRRVQADPASIAFAALAEEYRRIGHYEEAIETCRVGLQRHPAYLSARVTLGRALIELGEYGAAREELETVLHSAPENLAAIRGLAQIHDRLGHVAEMHPSLVELANEPLPVAKAPAPAPAPVEAPPAPVEARPPVTIAEPPPLAIPEPAPLAIEEPAPLDIEEPAPAIAFEAAPLNEPIEEISFDTALPQPPAIPAIDLRQFEEDIDLEPGAGPDPTALLVIARLERFLGAIQRARSATL